MLSNYNTFVSPGITTCCLHSYKTEAAESNKINPYHQKLSPEKKLASHPFSTIWKVDQVVLNKMSSHMGPFKKKGKDCCIQDHFPNMDFTRYENPQGVLIKKDKASHLNLAFCHVIYMQELYFNSLYPT